MAWFAQDEVFETEEGALEKLFGAEARIVRGRVTLNEDQDKAIEKRLGHAIHASHPVIVAADPGGKPLGFAMVWDEVGKYKPITFMVGTDPEGKIKGVHILVYREPIGSDVSKAWWRRQFEGKSAKDSIKRDRDIMKIGGATMSCDGVCLGTRKVVAIIDAALVKTPDNVARIVQGDPKEKPVRRRQLVMGTLCTIEAYGNQADAAIGKAFDEIQRLDNLLSNYTEDSELSRMNQKQEFEMSADLAAFVSEALKYAQLTEGAFDPTIEPAVRLWGFFDHRFKVPADDKLAHVRSLVDYRQVKLDGTKIRFGKAGMAVDPGGLGKGYALDRAVKILRDAGVTSAFIDFGHSSLYALGAPPGESGWLIGIKNPQDPTENAFYIRLKDASLSTSAQYEKLFEEQGKTYGHILDPHTCVPVETMGSVTVVHEKAALADALSTAFFVWGSAKSLEKAKELGVETALIPVDKSLRIEKTPGFEKLVVSEK